MWFNAQFDLLNKMTKPQQSQQLFVRLAHAVLNILHLSHVYRKYWRELVNYSGENENSGQPIHTCTALLPSSHIYDPHHRNLTHVSIIPANTTGQRPIFQIILKQATNWNIIVDCYRKWLELDALLYILIGNTLR